MIVEPSIIGVFEIVSVLEHALDSLLHNLFCLILPHLYVYQYNVILNEF